MKNKIKNMLLAAGMFGTLMLLTACGKSETEILWEETQAVSEISDGGMPEETQVASEGSSAKAAAKPTVIVVDICGAVRNPGVYELREGDRIRDAVEMARGLTEDADLTAINQAEAVYDGMKIRVYTREETANMPVFQNISTVGTDTGQGNTLAEDPAEGKVNINTADEKELISLSGIGPSRAADIIAYRTEHGPFQTKEEIMNVTGIKDATFNKIKDYIVAE